MYYRTAPVFGEAAEEVDTSPSVRPGSQGPAVADLQRKLNAWASQSNQAGSPLIEDGVYGPVTAARVRAFQQTVGLTPDGVAGPQTQQQLTRFAGGPVSPRISPSDCDRIRKSCELVAKFDFDRSTLNPEHFPIINGIAQCVADSFGTPTPILSILVIGHTDTRGPDWYNCELGRKRAVTVSTTLGQAIARECTARGLRPCPITMGQILTQSFGEKTPMSGVPGDDSQNRRVEVCLFTTPTPQLRPGGCSVAPAPPLPPLPKGDCWKNLAKCAFDCGFNHYLTKLKEIPQYAEHIPAILGCTRLGNPYAIAACILATVGPKLLPQDLADLKKTMKCLETCKHAFDQCRSSSPGPIPPPKPKPTGDCLKQSLICVGNCGLDQFLSNLKRAPKYLKLLPKILPCLRQKDPYAVAACVFAAVGPELLKDDFAALSRIVDCLKKCKREFDACRA